MPLTSPEMKAALVEHIDQLIRNDPTAKLIDALDAQSIEVHPISYSTIQIKVLPCNSGTWRYFTLKISEQQ
jgi:hypothetical protein